MWLHYTSSNTRKEILRLFVPPRVALSITSVPDGEVLALGGWPHNSTTEQWDVVKDESGQTIDFHPPSHWLMRESPAEIRNRYMGDRNFDLLVVGSSSKPVWAAAALQSNWPLNTLRVAGESPDHCLFGIEIPQKSWIGTNTHGASIDFTDYLAHSINNYHVRLNFLALANPASGSRVVAIEARDPARQSGCHDHEILNNAEWNHFPDLKAYGFTSYSLTSLHGIENSPLLKSMAEHFPVDPVQHTFRGHSVSFWSGNENDNTPPPDSDSAQDGGTDPWRQLGFISPGRTELDLAKSVTSPRDYITLLLGGSSNRWSNVDLPSAVYTALFGKPLVPHIGMISATDSTRTAPMDPRVLSSVRNGLEEMVRKGTGSYFFTASHPGQHTLAESLGSGYDFYAKTGTIENFEYIPHEENVSLARIVLVIVPHKNHGASNVPGAKPPRGLVLSLVAEYGGMATSDSNQSVEWISDFVYQNREALKDAMK